MTDKLLGLYQINTPVRLIYVDSLFEARAAQVNGKAKGEPKFGCTLFLPLDHPDLKPMRELVARVAKNRWPDKPISEIKNPFKTGESQIDKAKAKGKDKNMDYLRGHVVLGVKTKNPPAISFMDNGKMIDAETDVQLQMAKKKFWNGVEALVQLNFAPYQRTDEDSKDGITVYLNTVVSLSRGEKVFGGKSRGSEVFKGHVGLPSAEDPTGGDSLEDIMPL